MSDLNFNLLLIGCFTISTILTIWFLLGYLNSFINVSASIVKCGLTVVLQFIFKYTYKFIRPLIIPLAWLWGIISFIWSISILRALLLIAIAVGIFFFDHTYSLKFYDMDQIEFIKLVLFGKPYWITNIALTWASVVGLAGLFTLFYDLLDFLGYILDWPINITIRLNR